MSWCSPQHNLLPKQFYLQRVIAVSHWSGLRPLTSASLSILDPPRDSSQKSCCSPVSWRSFSCGSAGPAPSHAVTVHRWGGCWGGSTQNLELGPGRNLSWSACQISPVPRKFRGSPAFTQQRAETALSISCSRGWLTHA